MRNAIIFIATLCLLGCGHSETPVLAAERLLNEARQLMRYAITDAARDTVMSLRRRFPRAISVRRKAILTLDSIELRAAITDGDSLRQEFFARKLLVDGAAQ